jgi:hypothetical protein
MMDTSRSSPLILKVVRWTARTIGSLAAALVLLFFLAHTFGDQSEGGPPGLGTGSIFACWILGALFAWKWEGIGGLLMIAASAGFLFVTPAALWPPTPLTVFPIAGILFVVCWLSARRTGRRDGVPASLGEGVAGR